LNDRQKKALEFAIKEGRITNKDYRSVFPDITDRTVLNDLRDMVRKGVLKRHGRTKSVFYTIPK